MPILVPGQEILGTLTLCLLLTLGASGLAQLVRSLPWMLEAQLWLEGTRTKGKPLSCWLCLVGWCGLLELGLLVALVVPPWSPLLVFCLAMAWLGSTGLGGLVLQKLKPIQPASMEMGLGAGGGPAVPEEPEIVEQDPRSWDVVRAETSPEEGKSPC